MSSFCSFALISFQGLCPLMAILLPNRKKDHRAGWPLLKEAPRTGFEPVTYRLTAGRSTVELSRNTCSALQNDSSIHYPPKISQYFFSGNSGPHICLLTNPSLFLYSVSRKMTFA